MTYRITQKHLENIVVRINDALCAPQESYTRDSNGKLRANAGNVHLCGAYGGVRLEIMCQGGGTRDFLGTGYDTKRNVYEKALSWLDGRQSNDPAKIFTCDGYDFWRDASGLWNVSHKGEPAPVHCTYKVPETIAALKGCNLSNLKWVTS